MYKSTGSLWPLQLVFLLTLILGLIALFNPTLFGHQDQPDRTIGGYLLIAAVVTAILLYAPGVWTWMHLPAAAGTIQETRDALRVGNQEKLDLIRAEIGQLQGALNAISAQLIQGGAVRTAVDAISNQLNQGGEVRTRLDTISTQLAQGGDVRTRLDTVSTQLAQGGDVRTRLDTISAQLAQGGDVRTTLEAIKAKVGA